MQWGIYGPSSRSYGPISYPVAFSSKAYCIVAEICKIGSALSDDGYGRHIHNATTTSFYVINFVDSSYPLGWVAIGK